MGDEEIRALDDLTFNIEKGEFVALVGPSGSGKSTLMNIIGALDKLTEGKVIVGDTDLSKLSDDGMAKYRRKQIGFVFQTFNLQAQLTALENIELPLIFEGIESKKRKEMAFEFLEKMGLGDRARHRPSELSGGQQQRVAIARAIVNSPSILLADEPTGNLDSSSGDNIMNILRKLNEDEKVTILLVTHNEHFADFADRTFHMLDGKIVDEKRRRAT